jgi:hypothetical protein
LARYIISQLFEVEVKEMEEKIENEYTRKRFVAFLDIMGFKNRIQREKPDETLKMFMSLHHTLDNIKAKVEEEKSRKHSYLGRYFKNVSYSIIPPISFSDSIILISEDHTYESAQSIIVNSKFIISEALKNGIPMKGAIAYGDMTIDTKEHIYFGQSLVDAIELQKEIKLYGVVLDHTCEKQLYILDVLGKLGKDLVIKYKVPIESSKIYHYIININEVFEDLELIELWQVVETTSNPKDQLYHQVSGKPRIYVDNTIEFLEWLQDQKAKKEKNKKTKTSYLTTPKSTV